MIVCDTFLFNTVCSQLPASVRDTGHSSDYHSAGKASQRCFGSTLELSVGEPPKLKAIV